MTFRYFKRLVPTPFLGSRLRRQNFNLTIPPAAQAISEDDDNGSENAGKKMNLRFFKLNRVYLDPLDMSNAGDFSWY